MKKNNKQICFLYQGPHPVHKKFAESINAEFVEMEYNIFKLLKKYVSGELKEKFKKYNIVLCEGGKPLKEVYFIKKSLPKIKIIELGGSSLYMKFYKRSLKKRVFVNFLSSFIDGAIVNSNLTKEGIEKYIGCPVKVVYPFVDKDNMKTLLKIKPKLENNTIITIGAFSDYKNQGLLLKVFKKLKNYKKSLRAIFIGKYYPKEWKRIGGVICPGYVKDIKKYLEKSSLYVHTASAESFGVSVIEAMAAGVPCVVTESTGSKIAVEKVDKFFIVKSNVTEIASIIKKYLEMNSKEKEKISRKSRRVAKEFSEDKKCKEFKRKFEELLREIGV